MGGLLGGPKDMLARHSNYWGGGPASPLPPSSYAYSDTSRKDCVVGGEADRMSSNLSPLRSDDKIPLKSRTYQRFINSALIRRYRLNIIFSLVSNMYFLLIGLGNRCCIKITDTTECLVGKNELLRMFLSCKKA